MRALGSRLQDWGVVLALGWRLGSADADSNPRTPSAWKHWIFTKGAASTADDARVVPESSNGEGEGRGRELQGGVRGPAGSQVGATAGLGPTTDASGGATAMGAMIPSPASVPGAGVPLRLPRARRGGHGSGDPGVARPATPGKPVLGPLRGVSGMPRAPTQWPASSAAGTSGRAGCLAGDIRPKSLSTGVAGQLKLRTPSIGVGSGESGTGSRPCCASESQSNSTASGTLGLCCTLE